MKKNKLPSRFQIGEWVSINQRGLVVNKAEVIKVHFSNSKVMYDLDVEFIYDKETENGIEDEMDYTRIYNVDSVFVTDLIRN